MGRMQRLNKGNKSWKVHAVNVKTGVEVFSKSFSLSGGRDKNAVENTGFLYRVKSRLFDTFRDTIPITEIADNAVCEVIVMEAKWKAAGQGRIFIYTPKGILIDRYHSKNEAEIALPGLEKIYTRPSNAVIAKRILHYKEGEASRDEKFKQIRVDAQRPMIDAEKRKILANREAAIRAKKRADQVLELGDEEGSW